MQFFVYLILCNRPTDGQWGYIAKFIPVKIHETVDTRAAHFGPDVHEIVCRQGFSPDPIGGAYSAPPDPLAALRGPTSKRRGGVGRGKGGVGRSEGKGRVGRGKEGRGG